MLSTCVLPARLLAPAPKQRARARVPSPTPCPIAPCLVARPSWAATPRRAAACARAGAASSSSAPTPPAGGLPWGLSEGVKSRVAQDPSFLFKLGTEVAMDEAITFSANLAARGIQFWLWSVDTILQVVAHMLVACFNDVALVYFLAPSAEKEAPKDPALSMAHVFQVGQFTLAQRAACWMRKWQLYSVIGATTGLLSIVVTAVLSREASLFNMAGWARATLIGCLHLGISANTRYQLVNGVEVLIYRALPVSAARALSVFLRFGNNCLGSFSWIVLSNAVRNAWVI